jgi:methylmalonyl-CoA mutase N-terminal domain/subunit
MGGTLAAIESGYIQGEIQDAAYKTQRAIDAGESIVVGMNQYTDESSSTPVPVFQIDPAIERRQIERVRAVRASRSEHEWRLALDDIAHAAKGETNLVPLIVAAVEKRATLGEIADTLRGIFGEYDRR